MIVDFATTALGTFIGLLPIANPFSTAVVFLVAGALGRSP